MCDSSGPCVVLIPDSLSIKQCLGEISVFVLMLCDISGPCVVLISNHNNTLRKLVEI